MWQWVVRRRACHHGLSPAFECPCLLFGLARRREQFPVAPPGGTDNTTNNALINTIGKSKLRRNLLQFSALGTQLAVGPISLIIREWETRIAHLLVARSANQALHFYGISEPHERSVCENRRLTSASAGRHRWFNRLGQILGGFKVRSVVS